MRIFEFRSTFTTCEITGLKDETITELIIPDCVTSIGGEAFSYYSSLTSVEIPNSVTSIGDEAFSYCISLETIYCEAENQPIGWGSSWKGNCMAQVVWGYKG